MNSMWRIICFVGISGVWMACGSPSPVDQQDSDVSSGPTEDVSQTPDSHVGDDAGVEADAAPDTTPDTPPPSECADGTTPLICMAIPGCFWESAEAQCREPDALPPNSSPFMTSVTGSHVGQAQIEGAHLLPVAEATSVLSLYQDGHALRGTLVMQPEIDGVAVAYGYRIEGAFEGLEGSHIHLTLSERECVGDTTHALCDGVSEFGREKIYETKGYYDGTILRFGPATLRSDFSYEPGEFTPEGPFSGLRFTPHDGFKPAGAPDPDQRDEIVGSWSGGFSLVDGVFDDHGQTYIRCSLTITGQQDALQISSGECEGLPETWTIDKDSLAYDASNKRFWFLLEGGDARLLFVGTFDEEEEALGGLVVREVAETPRYWSAEAAPIDPLEVDFGDIVGVMHFFSVPAELL
ncbi:MAG: hypothetical protein ACNA8W_21380 [Bradymonadaceae bacterium]